MHFLQGKNLACAMMAPREEEGCTHSGHVTGQRSLRGRGSRKGLQRAPTNTMLFSDYHLAKLNPKCYMNYCKPTNFRVLLIFAIFTLI